MTRILFALSVAMLTVFGADAADPPALGGKFLGKWALPGKGKLRWVVFADGTITGTADVFDTLDADKDGLLSAEEAEKAKK